MKSSLLLLPLSLVALVQGFQSPCARVAHHSTSTRHFSSNFNNNFNNNNNDDDNNYNQEAYQQQEENWDYYEQEDYDYYEEEESFLPKLFKPITNWEGINAVPLVPLRILTGLLMIHHGSEGGIGPANVGTEPFKGFVDFIIKPYFGFLPGPPELWGAIHDYIEFYGGIFLALGFLTRPAALLLLGTMLSAVFFHLSSVGSQGFPLGHVPNYSYDFEEPTLYALIFFVFWFNGAGPLSIDSFIYSLISKEEEGEEEYQEYQDY